MDLTQEEYQQLVVMLGSKKALGKFLGLKAEELNLLWKEKNLTSPLNWIRSKGREFLLETVAFHGSIERAAKYLNVSSSSLRKELAFKKNEISWTREEFLSDIEKYKSVRFMARVKNCTELHIRNSAKELKIDLPAVVDFSFGGSQNSKGRRAELDYLALREEKVLKDLNVEEGSQAPYDFEDSELGKVNVKSSKRFKYTAQSRSKDPYYWKFSTKGWEAADLLVCLCYDERMSTLLGFVVVETKGPRGINSVAFTSEDMMEPKCLTNYVKNQNN